jgi:hypothetical protein
MRTGVPRSVLIGRVVGKREPMWLPEDIDGLLALQEIEDGCCPGCGHPMGESMDEDLRDLWDTHTVQCHACAAIDRRKRRLSTGEDPGNEPTDGLKIIPYKDEAVDDGD